MSILDIFGTKNERQNIVGQVDCTAEDAPTVFLGLMQTMGMSNPSVSISNSSKGVSISKKGKKYTLVLEMFQPPIQISWEDPIDYNQILSFINKISRGNNKVCWVNFINMSDGSKSLQFAIDQN